VDVSSTIGDCAGCAGARARWLALAFVDIRDAVVDLGFDQSEDVFH
jgi:hypothetical protein